MAGIEDAELIGILNTNATGTAADNVLIGNLGNNTLDGKGAWIFYGGMGADSFVLSYNGDGTEADVVGDFNSDEDLLIIDLDHLMSMLGARPCWLWLSKRVSSLRSRCVFRSR